MEQLKTLGEFTNLQLDQSLSVHKYSNMLINLE